MAKRSPSTSIERTSSSSSFESIGSIGIGSSSGISGSPGIKLILDITRLRPEDGTLPENVSLYDCIVYFMMCPNHDRIAITRLKRGRNNNRDSIIWLPFIVLQDNVTWEQAAQDGLTMLFGYRDDEDSMQIVNGGVSKLPPMQVTPMQFLRFQMSGDRYFIRYTHFVHMEKQGDYVCCQDIEQSDRSSVITWMTMNEIVQNEYLWGPEMLNFTEKLAEQMTTSLDDTLTGSQIGGGSTVNDQLIDLQINEQTLDDVCEILTDKIFGKFLTACKMTNETVIAIYEEYMEHCWPSTLMCMAAFKTFLIRYGYSRSDTSAQEWIFNALDINRLGYLDFNQILIGIVCLDPNTSNEHSIRLKMIFRFYALEKNDELSFEEFVSLVHDLYPNLETKKLRQMVEDLEKKIRDLNNIVGSGGGSAQPITFQIFEQAIRNRILKGTEKLVRSTKSIITLMLQMNKMKKESRSGTMIVRHHKSPPSQSTTGTTTTSAGAGAGAGSKNRNRNGTCNGCRIQKYKFGSHCVCLDTSGRCVKPLRLFDVEIRDTITPSRYSAEYVFGMNTICRNFLDLVRRAYLQNDNLFSTSEDLPLALQTIRTLCEFVRLILECEDRFMKINAPAIVIGDICGRIESLMSLEKVYWTQVPIITTNLIFLGNYISGQGSTMQSRSNVDVICYLFALKIAAPNQVCLLRGYNETSDQSKELLKECVQKYGQDDGRQMWTEFNRAFNLLPYAILVDENILCVHSGLPRLSMPINKFSDIPKKVANLAKESPLALELISSVPKDPSDNQQTFSNSDERRIEFNQSIFRNFMQTNSLSFMVRGHDQPNDGFRLHFDNRLITITSAIDRNSTILLIDSENDELRLVRVTNASTISTRTKDDQFE
ncbi:uncharacterized protein LOC113788451 [Dermatophagoides pteronyssinus]|uniref:Uncharacterized protein LOC113788451 n=1 Tax=Dermatophagoides pteronyssinus TaxID=6956 RepID=A0A6P6XJI5_DERPT|nr:uncharacterized protein LOC113788451 [Dermatophagoides pteronyssinus]